MTNEERFLLEDGETDMILKESAIYAEARARSFVRKYSKEFRNIEDQQLKPKHLMKAMYLVLAELKKDFQEEMEACHIIGELLMSERFYTEIRGMKPEEVSKDELLGMLQVVMAHIQNVTIDKCSLPQQMKTSVEEILQRDGFYDGIPAVHSNYGSMPPVLKSKFSGTSTINVG